MFTVSKESLSKTSQEAAVELSSPSVAKVYRMRKLTLSKSWYRKRAQSKAVGQKEHGSSLGHCRMGGRWPQSSPRGRGRSAHILDLAHPDQ